jgi:PAS domain S-box-containing protein
MQNIKTEEELLLENEELRLRLAETEATLEAIRNGEVDAIVVSGKEGEKIFTLASAETPYRIIIEEMEEGAVTVGEDDTILFCNRRFANLINTPMEKILGAKFIDFISGEEHAKYNQMLQQSLKGRITQEITSFNKNGEPVYLHLSTCMLPEGMNGKICIIVSDITELKRHQQNLQELVNERTKELNKTNTELKEINSTKDKLFSIIAHDLRGPFTSLLGYSDLMIENLHKYDKSKFEQILFHINSAAKDAYTLLENLLIWARSKNGQLRFNPQWLNLAVVLEEIRGNLNSLAMIKNITITNRSGASTLGFADENMLQAIVRNLVANAIKFCKPGGEIEIFSTSGENWIEIAVKDNGVGMPPEMRDKLLRSEETSSSTGTAHEKGTGLGLLICREFVDKHQGRIWVESEPGEGSCFYFTLPNP